MALRIDVEIGQTVKIGNNVTIVLEQKSGRRARLRIDSTEPVTISEAVDKRPDEHTYQRKSFGV